MSDGKITILPIQLQSLYSALIESNKEYPLEGRFFPSFIESSQGKYILFGSTAHDIFIQLEELDRNDGIPDGHIDTAYVVENLFSDDGSMQALQVPGIFNPNGSSQRLKTFLEARKVVDTDLDYEVIEKRLPEDAFEKLLFTANYNGWTPEKMRKVQAIFEDVCGVPFIFSVGIYEIGSRAKTYTINEVGFADKLSIYNGLFTSINIAKPAANYSDEKTTRSYAEHEKVHIDLLRMLSTRDPLVFEDHNGVKTVNYSKKEDALVAYFREANNGSIGNFSPKFWGLVTGNKRAIHWLEETMVIGYHISKGTADKSEGYIDEIQDALTVIQNNLSSSGEIGELIYFAAHYRAIALRLGKMEIADKFYKIFQSRMPSILPAFEMLTEFYIMTSKTLQQDPDFNK